MEFKDLSIKEESKRFKEHLILENNNRIILSGIFGIGKTYFIDNFFKANSNEFIVIKLNPVNYSVSQNEDIFELIKFDIGYQLFKENPNFEKIEINKLLATEFFVRQNFEDIIESLANNLSKLDHRLNSIVRPILNLKDKIQGFKEQNEIDEEKDLIDFLKEFKLKKGTFREENSITELINILLQTLKENFSEKKTVLVIDDLDRIDPEHIFRILNIFSAHFDYYELNGENKFGFDKVILICDIDNIRGIFHNQYGTDIDFSGYIDKFYSLEIFEYNFSNILISSLEKFFRSINSNDKSIVAHIINNSSNYYTKELSFLLGYFINSNTLSMRSLVNFLKIDYRPNGYVIKTGSSHKIYTKDTPIFLVFEILIKLFGGLENFKFAVEKTIKKFPIIEMSTYNDYWNQRLGNLIMLLEYNKTNLKPQSDTQKFYDLEIGVKINYEINPTDYGIVGKAQQIGEASPDSPFLELRSILNYRIKYFQILKKALLVYERIPKQIE
ncbi:hypothetical protein FHG64_06315 [Antarcticibacterium flavum]|uniref:KAP NTPase domain-containing protein n=1 Tax=Antarcticibacterium flavum TaxID=2058175 RepID=A0A5B7X1C0_9FLAO|nr:MULTISPECIES: P-loop NTPase fold protein [Antarcticibacterium]MCM4161891.1 hypothetical protein [Antarcticibacterium sp. W02-3]QCY69050.1 hypothetical protein FHG64_06315 [Antarcticibacterium flavum]